MKNTGPCYSLEDLFCYSIEIEEGIELKNHVLYMTQLPCCARLALPFWAKITGRIGNTMGKEGLFLVTIILLDDKNREIAQATDMIALDGHEHGDFEVKLEEHQDYAKAYSIAVKEVPADFIP